MSSLKAIGLGKRFPGVVALDDVNLEVKSGTVHALVGANGAGKSTLIKILSGYYATYDGQIEQGGKTLSIHKPTDAMAHGIEVVHQEVDTALIPYLSAAENLLIQKLAVGQGPQVINWGEVYREAQQMADRVGLSVDMRKTVADLSLSEKQLLVIARAVARNVKFLILDEPTASLSLRETEKLFEIVKQLKAEGVGIIYISHRLAEVREIADEITVLRGGKAVAHFPDRSFDMDAVLEAMIGAPAGDAFPPRPPHNPGEVVLEARNLTRRGHVHGVSLQVRKGEILGITGMVGAGKTELIRLLFGADRLDAGEIRIDGKPVRIGQPRDAVRNGIFLVPEERRKQGLLVENTIASNLALPFLELFSRLGWMIPAMEGPMAETRMRQVGVHPPMPQMLVRNLSGGNQQKVVIGKWLNKQPRVMLFDEATHGIDVKAKRDVYELARELCQESGVVYASSDIDEVLGLADRILVMRDGAVVAELTADEAQRQLVLEYATGTRS